MDGHGIDNLYIGVEVGGNADEKLDEIDKSLENVTESVEKFEQTFTKIEVLGKILDNFREKTAKLVGEGKNLENTDLLSNLNKEFAALDRYNKELSKTKPISEADYKTAEEAIEKVSTETGRLEETLRVSKQRLAELASQGKENTTQFVNLASKIAKVEEKLSELKAKTLPPLLDEKDISGAQPLGDVPGIRQTSRFRKILSKIREMLSRLGAEGDKAFKKIDKSTKKANNSSKGYQKGLRGLLETAKRFLVFGTFFTIQRQISQAFQEGTQNLYQYSKAIDGKFAQSMDRLATSFLYLKNAVGAAVAPIINAVTPALESLIDTVADFGNKLAETFAALSGQSTFKKAIKSHKEYAEAVDNTNNALAKFDEINNITTSKSKEEQDFSSMFVETQVSTPDWANDIAKGIKNRDWNSVGSTLSKKLNEQIKKLDEIDIGEKIGEKINGALDFANGFIGTFDFGNFARTLTTQITNFIKTINWGRIGELFSSSIIGAFNFLSEIARWFGSKETRQSVFNAVIKFIDNIDWVGIGKNLATFTLDTIVAVIKWALDIRNWAKLIGTVIKAAGKLLFGIFDGVLTKVGLGGVAQKLGKSFGLYANGGYPASGEVFIARENGLPEMVGSIGGRTAVANNDQIVEAISIGVYNAYMDAMSRSGGNKQPTIVQINGREVFRAVQDESTAYSIRTGQPAF